MKKQKFIERLDHLEKELRWCYKYMTTKQVARIIQTIKEKAMEIETN